MCKVRTDKSVPRVTDWHHSPEPRDAKTVTLGTDLSVRTSHSLSDSEILPPVSQILTIKDDKGARNISSPVEDNYENMPMQYTAIFHGCKIDNFQMKILIFFLIFAQNIDCEAVLTSTHNLCFGAKIRKICIPK